MLFIGLVVYFGSVSASLAKGSSDASQDESKNNIGVKEKWSYTGKFAPLLGTLEAISTPMYIDGPENIMRIPSGSPFIQERKKKPPKKSAKRTIQKIIKKNRSKKKMINQVTSSSSVLPPRIDEDSQDAFSSMPYTTQPSHKQRLRARKNSKKLPRIPMPFQNRHGRNQRYRRDLERDNTLIINDFDEAKFISQDKDYDVVNVHVKDYW